MTQCHVLSSCPGWFRNSLKMPRSTLFTELSISSCIGWSCNEIYVQRKNPERVPQQFTLWISMVFCGIFNDTSSNLQGNYQVQHLMVSCSFILCRMILQSIPNGDSSLDWPGYGLSLMFYSVKNSSAIYYPVARFSHGKSRIPQQLSFEHQSNMVFCGAFLSQEYLRNFTLLDGNQHDTL